MADKEMDFVNYSFDDLVTQLTNKVKEKDAWKDTYRSGTGQMLIELLAYVGNLVLYYTERRAEESYILTAQNRSSIINLVRLLNYVPRRGTSSTGILTFSIVPGHSAKIFIPQYTECQSNSGIKYLTKEDVVMEVGQTSIDVDAIQGELQTITFTATGILSYEYNISKTNVENDNLFVYVNGELWTKVDSFIDAVASSKQYILRHELDDTITIIFGDNVFGKAPDDGDSVLIKYIETEGASGNVYDTARITTVTDALVDEDGIAITLEVTNNDVFLGGADEETAEEIRYNGPRVFSTGDRAVTKEDYLAILVAYGSGIKTVNVWGERSESPPNYDMFNRVKIAMVLDNWQLPSQNFKDELTEYLYDTAMLTVKYEYVNPVILNIIPVVDIYALRSSSLSAVQSGVETTLQNQFLLGDTSVLGESKYYSDVVRAVDETEGVDHVNLSLEVRQTYSAEDPGTESDAFEQDFNSSVGFSYDPAKTEFVGGSMRQIDFAPTDATCGALFTSSVDLSWGDGVLTGAAVGGASVSGGKLILDGGTKKHVDYNASGNADSPQSGTVRFKFTPNYSGSPAAHRVLFCESKEAGSTSNLIQLYHLAFSGNLLLQIRNFSGGLIMSYTIGAWSPTAAQEYELEINYDITAGATRLFIDGVQLGVTATQTGVRDSNIGLLRVGSDYNAFYNSDFKIDDLVIFNSVQHTSNYTPGYTLPEDRYEGDNIIIPPFVYTGDYSIAEFVSFIITGSVPNTRFILNDLYYNGSSWVASDGSYAQASSASVVDSNLATFPLADSITIKILTVTGARRTSISHLALDFRVLLQLILTPIFPGSIQIYRDTTLIAIDDDNGNIIGVGSSGSDFGGSIAYATGHLKLNVSPSQDIIVRYQQDENGNLLIGKNQILKLYDIDINSIQYVS